MKTTTKPTLSIVIPAKNERETLRPLCEKILAVFSGEPEGWIEIILVDDGSNDGSWPIIQQLHAEYPCIHGLRFYRNRGKSEALAAGIEHAQGNLLVTIDADLQDEPSEIPHLIEKLNEGYDLVSGWKKERKDPWHKRWFSAAFNAIVCYSGGIRLHDINCGLKAYRKQVFEPIRLYGEMHRFIPILAAHYGFRVTEIPVTHHPRQHGKSHFGSERIIRAAFDFLTVNYIIRYLQCPMHFYGLLTLLFEAVGFLLLFLGMYLIAGDSIIRGAIVALAGILFALLGFQSLFFGWVAESQRYLWRWDAVYFIVHEKTDHPNDL